MNSYIIAFSGTHGTGKTTSVYQKAMQLKIGHPDKAVGIFCENAGHSPYRINKQTSAESQMWIFSNQISEELKLLARCDIVVADRTVVDAIAYTAVAGLEDLAERMTILVYSHIEHYRRITFNTIARHPYHFNDGIRDAEDKAFRKRIEEALLELYDRLGLTRSDHFVMD